MRRLRVGTRASDLALWQTSHVAARLRHLDPALDLEVIHLSTTGDDLADAPLERMEGTGFFTSTLERALLAGEIDIAVHSYKDLPTLATAGLVIAATLERAPVEDVLCARGGRTLRALEPGARIGTSSPRRTAQIKALQPDLDFVSLRGNVPTRLARVERGDLDGAILARAGLERLGLIGHATEIFGVDQVLPAPAQGALAIQARLSDADCVALLAGLEHAETRRAVDAERAVLHALRGGCSVPVGAFARVTGRVVALDAGVFDPAGGPAVRTRMSGADPVALGEAVAGWLVAHGARRILDEIDRTMRSAAVDPS